MSSHNPSKAGYDQPVSEAVLIISPEMIKMFAALTGDFSSLHMDADFGRTSAFRANVAHGMLPVLFVLCPSVCWRHGKRAWIQKLSGTFLKPVFAGDELRVALEPAQSDQDTAAFEFSIIHTASKAVVTMGKIELCYGHPGESSPERPLPDAGSLLLTPLKERENVTVEKGTSDSFPFRLSLGTKGGLLDILRAGLLNGDAFPADAWDTHCDSANLLSVSLCSTFVGMCIPGKKATFIDFHAEFLSSLPWDQTYRFAGEIKFHSPSTNILVEKWEVLNAEGDGPMLATGDIKTRVNNPRRLMPSVAELKERALDLQLNNKVALVTGASRGIGETTAKLLSLFGVSVVVNYHRGEADALRVVREIEQAGGKALAFQADVADRRQVEAMVRAAVEKFGRIDILVNNAVRDFRPTPFLETTWEEAQKDMDVIVKGAFNCCQEVLPLMVARKAGKIINVGTVAVDNPPPHQAKYVVAKSALVGLTRSLAVEFAGQNIQVNMVVPAFLETDLTGHMAKVFVEKIKSDSPMKRNASPEDVAQAVVFLASSFSSYTTGQKIMVTGGQAPLL
ncbi:MAG: SDR family oxidoreductase [Candidatus Omnitrophota bacterium]|nr:SDR family oxidoreductase [Candidatus Omnitrophota bacterium]